MQPLFANPMLPLLAIAFASNAFEDYHSFEEIFAIPPPVVGAIYEIRIRKEMLQVPFFQVMSPNGPTGKIQGAASFDKRMVDLGHRAGYLENITVHAMRREVLVKADGRSRLEETYYIKH
jgi:carbonic anhydrase